MFEKSVPEAERHPKPPELTKEQEKAFKDSIKDLKPKEKKERTKVIKDERVTADIVRGAGRMFLCRFAAGCPYRCRKRIGLHIRDVVLIP